MTGFQQNPPAQQAGVQVRFQLRCRITVAEGRRPLSMLAVQFRTLQPQPRVLRRCGNLCGKCHDPLLDVPVGENHAYREKPRRQANVAAGKSAAFQIQGHTFALRIPQVNAPG